MPANLKFGRPLVARFASSVLNISRPGAAHVSGLKFARQLTSNVRGLEQAGFVKEARFVDLTSKLCSRVQLEHVVIFWHCKFKKLGGHLEQIPYVHAIWRVQLQNGVL